MLFHKTPPTPTPTKKIIYLISWVVLGALLGFLAYIFIEIKYISWIVAHDTTIVSFNDKVIWPLLHFGLLLLGAIGGYFLGRMWWRKVYIEKYWEKKFNNLK
ncbi:MAG: hypothetical protein KBC69_04840 [Candidatus Magasanikbacteria bacterium]|nr:hypothetical protein [Candidatus Magasanikbacteria bacterium]